MKWWVLRRKLAVAWLIAAAGGTFVLGVYSTAHLPVGQFYSIAWLLTGCICVVVALYHRYVYLLPVLIVGGLCIGVWRGSTQQLELTITQSLTGATLVTGTVREDVDTDARGQLVLRLSNLKIGAKEAEGNAWVTTRSGADIQRSDRVSLEGQLQEGFGSFVVAMYDSTLTKLERPEPGDVALEVRDWFADGVRTAVSDPEASLGIGYLLGQKRALPLELAEALQIVGLTHIVVASGYNLTILVRLARRLFEKVSKYLAALSASAMIAGFIAITGMSPSMSRAGLVAGLSLAAWYYGRKFHPVILLLIAAAVTVAVNPSYIWGDLGWQLSFAAFGGVMILAPLLQRFFFGEKKPGFVRQIFGETLSAVIATAPILMYAFGQFSNVAVIANMLVLPLVPLAMLLTAVAGFGAIIFPSFAEILGLPASWLLGYMVYIAESLAKLPWAVSTIQFSLAGVVIAYSILVCICIILWRVTKYNLRDTNIVE